MAYDIEALRKQHGRVEEIETAAGRLAFRKPTRAEWRKFKIAIAGDPESLASADDNLMLDTIVSHSREELSAMLEADPGLSGTAGMTPMLKRLAGAAVSDGGKG
jgi:hypothetical protein